MATAARPGPVSPRESSGAAAIPRPRGKVGGLVSEVGDIVVFGAAAFRAVPGSLRYGSEALRHASVMTRGSWFLFFVMNMFIGITIVNFAYFLLRALGASDALGLFSGYITPRQTCPQMIAYVFVAKIACGMAASIGAMKIQQEVDALETEGIDPMEYVVGTRLVAVIIFVPIASIISLAGIDFGSYVNAVDILHGVSSGQFTTLHWGLQSIRDELFVIGVAYVMVVPAAIIGCFYGLRATGGPAAVGRYAARSMVVNLVLVHILLSVSAVLVYGIDLHVPIGG